MQEPSIKHETKQGQSIEKMNNIQEPIIKPGKKTQNIIKVRHERAYIRHKAGHLYPKPALPVTNYSSMKSPFQSPHNRFQTRYRAVTSCTLNQNGLAPPKLIANYEENLASYVIQDRCPE